ncbi:hypothetical protein F0P96_05705 [Hymenobacter busanensis]|uniref:Uncharacterized protein n=1 Tax=Hymenobacter busanensis TaxID=2607656 RepID=A0A7L5A2B0_9BACT|nr:hypothetical protein [Hymenobacter busanensis]KAA9338329.1 hypothetical protein F0P96_05705 [Hymenobacter busanensis]QHJ09246.1 hypothetical protein GUY19_18905 [Hymenobacter busanensis]
MKYQLWLRSKPEASVEEKHKSLITALQSLEEPWRLHGADFPTPEFGSDLYASFSFHKCLSKGIRGHVFYRYRNMLADTSGHDDYLYFEFNARKIDFRYIVDSVLPALIRSFNAYYGYLAIEELIYVDFNKSRHRDYRKELVRFYPVFFMSDELCTKALGFTARSVKAKLENTPTKTELLNDGILLISSYSPLTVAESARVDTALNSLLCA